MNPDIVTIVKTFAALKKLNTMGYAQPEKRFRQMLERKWGVTFNDLFSFSNAPLGRFRCWLERSGNLSAYLKKLADGFNPCAVDRVMCRTLVSVSWDGYLYDCDFNLTRGLPVGGNRIHVTDMNGHPEPESLIATEDHCYTCTAGAGFT